MPAALQGPCVSPMPQIEEQAAGGNPQQSGAATSRRTPRGRNDLRWKLSGRNWQDRTAEYSDLPVY